jgi:hypothetical protein
MAEDYTIQGFTETSELQGGNVIVRVREFHVVTKPSGIYFQFRRPKAKWAPANIASVAKQLADRIEGVNASPHVTGMLYSQDVDAAGHLVDMFTVFYEADDGAISGSVEQRMAQLYPATAQALIVAEIAAGGDYLSL